uniref:Uncharacterized protein n=1 Tax=Meloidogyne enterolobii TaxID=390850 RepID=A0A6V7U3L8_MELEN|nr:unnamed protein product [Meloidogyne enterolobii]
MLEMICQNFFKFRTRRIKISEEEGEDLRTKQIVEGNVGGKVQEKTDKHQKRETKSSGPLRLFRAVTGRRHVNTALVRLSHSRSLSHNPSTDVESTSNPNNNENGTGQEAIIFYSLKGNRNAKNMESTLPQTFTSTIIPRTTTATISPSTTRSSLARVDEAGGILPSTTMNENSRALTAPGDFRRKKGGGGVVEVEVVQWKGEENAKKEILKISTNIL